MTRSGRFPKPSLDRLVGRPTGRRLGVLLPVALFLALATLLAAYLLDQRRGHLDAIGLRTSAIASQTGSRLASVIEKRLAMVRQLRDEWQQPERQLDELRAVASLLQGHSPGVLALNWVDVDGTILWVTPEDEVNLKALGQNLIQNPVAGPFFLAARNQGVDRITAPLQLYQGGWGFAAYLPVQRDETTVGFLNTVIRFSELLADTVPPEVLNGYDLTLFYDDRLIYEQLLTHDPMPEEFARVAEFDAAGNHYRLRLIPKPQTITPIGARLWPVALVGGLGAALLAILTRLLVVGGAELRRQRQLVERVFSGLPVSALRIAADGTIEQSLGAGAERLGLLQQEPDDDSFDTIPMVADHLARALDGEAVEFEHEGVWRGAPWTYQFFFFPDEVRGQGAIGFAIDISDRKRAEEALRRSEEQYRRFFQEAPFAYFVVDPDGLIELANPRAAALAGRDVEDLRGRSVLDLYAPGSLGRTRAAELFDRMLLGEEIRNLEVKLQSADGSIRWGSLSIQAIHDGSGELTGCRYLLVDITQRKELEERFRQSQKMEAVGRLAGGVAHDFNNLLTAIMGYARLGLAGADDDAPVRRDLEEIQKAGQRAASLVSQLLAFSRRQIVETKVFDLNRLVRDMDPMLRRLVREEVEIFTRLDPDIGRLRMDPGQMEQVVMNLVVNSQEAIERTGLVTLETDEVRPTAADRERAHGTPLEDEVYVRLRVSDDGSGMGPDVLSHVFEPFFTTKRDGAGTGLGLATVYGIVEQAGGSILVSSHVGEGTTVTILLPKVDEDLFEETVAVRGDLPKGRETILLVEDEEMVRNLATQMLRSLGYEVIPAVDGVAALEIVEGRTDDIDLLLTDVVMPRMGGETLYEELRRKRSDLPVLYTSGYTESTVIHSAVREGGVPFMHKPYTLEDLAAAVRQALDDHQGDAASVDEADA